MGTDFIQNGCYITIAYDWASPDGRMVNSYQTEEEAINHVKFQKETMNSTAKWSILHIKDMEWISI